MGGVALAADPRPGRCCPTDYRYRPEVLRAVDPLRADVLWVVGGLYGNTEALRVLNAHIGAETAERVVVVANGDFHWFDAHHAAFGEVEAGVAGWHRLRGNVETELARADPDGAGAGCGCAYPEDVPDADVDRSKSILGRLRATARRAGAAGMANFAGSPWGVATRIARAATSSPRGLRTLYRAHVAGAEVAAVAVEFDLAAWLRAFDAQRPAGSPAEQSYRRRIVHGPDHRPEQAALGAFASPLPESPTPTGASQR